VTGSTGHRSRLSRFGRTLYERLGSGRHCKEHRQDQERAFQSHKHPVINAGRARKAAAALPS
jgi:hypothetical protein